ncbi:MAG: SDR family NAD(P)-dependent oxidoreductase [Limnobacter sp.]|uniref:SDR family NAD(P)-dependent oxidoreductase n=1 Tax=Limnobacter sp. TaxID=2003368 RepID=UPI0022C6ECE2|nr:SDR family NAD(P)-dependent oxidoreductase [Limnobacter sp.]MCZ8015213.1 SDR family NAD(P)-dependent oxidoreductase [Limnobacter sp.]
MNRTAVITGASSGIGKALALEFAKRGYNLGLAARRIDRLEALRAEIASMPGGQNLQVEITALDVSNTELVGPVLQGLFNTLEKVDVVVVNAGVNKLTGVGKGQLNDELALMQTNLLGAMATVNAAVEWFKQHGGGHVVGISSLASLTPIPKQAAYCATKAGFSMYLDAAAIELKKYKIDFTKILPGFVKTDIVDNMEQYPFLVSAEQAAKEMANHIEKRRSVGVVPGYPWKILKPLLANMPSGVWRYMK